MDSVGENGTPGNSKDSAPSGQKSPKGRSNSFSFVSSRSLRLGAQNLLSNLSRVASPKSGVRATPSSMGGGPSACCTVSETQVKEVHHSSRDSITSPHVQPAHDESAGTVHHGNGNDMVPQPSSVKSTLPGLGAFSAKASARSPPDPGGSGTAGSGGAAPKSSSSAAPAPSPDAKAPAPGGSIAARRGFKPTQGAPLLIDTKKDKKKKRERRRIRVVDAISAVYEMGAEVMPSSHSGMSVIFAKRLEDGLEVVIKVRAKSSSFCDQAEEKEWRRSTEFMMNLPETQGIAKLYEVLEDKKGYYVIMEKVQGQDLFETCVGKGLLPMAEVKEVLRQLLQALQELHSRNCIHKDLKLENIMFDRTPPHNAKIDWSQVEAGEKHSPVQVKLIDFDTVETVVPKSPKKAIDVLGTDQYIAQEAYDGNYSSASDVFAAGVIGYRLLTSKFPFKSDIFNDEAGENWVGSPKMKEIRDKLCKFKIDWSHRAFAVEPHAKELLEAMLAVNEQHRPTAEEALGHPWLVTRQRRRSLPNISELSQAIASQAKHAAAGTQAGSESSSGFDRQISG